MWRQMTIHDIDNVCSISYSEWGENEYETYEIFLDKLEHYPKGCFVYDIDGIVKGFLTSYPSNSSIVPSLNTKINKNINIDSYFIHEIVLHKDVRGSNVSQIIINKILEDNNIVCLCSVPKSVTFWEKYGFKKTNLSCYYGFNMIYKK